MEARAVVVSALLVATLGPAGAARAQTVGQPAQPPAADSTGQPALPLWPGGAPGALGSTADDRPTVTPFLPPPGRANGTAAVIFPGGGYDHLAFEKEGVRPARWLNSLGVSAFVVRYRLGARYHHPAMLRDAQRAVRLVRARATEWGVDPARVGVVGFSAGGHLASTVATHFDRGSATSSDAVERESSRPDFMVLVYPVITMTDPYAHRGSRANLLGERPSRRQARLLSNETQVTRETPPTFLVATTDDASVPVENSLMFYRALKAAAVPAELHVFESGRHGFGLAPNDPVLATWMAQCAGWMGRRGLVAAPAPSAAATR